MPAEVLHLSTGSRWRGAFLCHARYAVETEGRAEFSSFWITQRMPSCRGLLPAREGGRAPPVDATLQLAMPGEVYRSRFPHMTEALSLYVDRGLLERTLHAPCSKLPLGDVTERLHRDRVIEHLMQALLSDAVAGSPGGPLLGETIVAAVVHRLHAAGSAPTAGGDRGVRLTRRETRLLDDHIAANLSGPLHLEDLAGLLGVSVRHFCRAFRNTAGLSPHQYVLRCRVARARELLGHSGLSLDAVAEQSGFAHRSHMAVAFRRFLNRTPGEVRGRHPA